MGEKRKYNPELKAEAIKMVNEQGKTHAEASRKLGIYCVFIIVSI